MAIYHLSMQIISRSKGQSAVAAAAYRSAERLTDERTGENKYYVRKVKPDTMILAPSNAPEWVQDRNRLWNEVEHAEKRKDSQLAREINIALPRELSKDQQKELIRSFIQEQFVDKGMIADIAIHRDDEENPHAHVMLTTREITADGFGPKNRDWNDKELLNQWREEWSNHANKALEKEGIQERISHLSHEDRGLEQLPTVHLGHVAHEMEKRGVESERGNINRDRQEYNRLVVDLQKYREARQAIEQELARKQEQKQKIERFNTAAERVDLQKASKLLKGEVTLTKILERREQLHEWEERVSNSDQSLRLKNRYIEEASDQYIWIHSFENQIQQAQQRIENINWFNPLKIKENRSTKERAEQSIAKAKDDLTFHDKKLNNYREKLGFTTEQEFSQVKKQHEADRPGLLEKNRNTQEQIRYEQDVLQKAENALKNAFVRQVASNYPESLEMPYISFSAAQKLHEVNKKHQKIVPIQAIEQFATNKKQEIQRLENEIYRIDQYRTRLQRAENYLRNYEKHHAVVEKYESNPFRKGKILVSKSAKYEYESAVIARNSYQEYMKNEGITGRTDFEKQKNILGKMEVQIPEFKSQIQSEQKISSLFDAIIKGITQAEQEMRRKQRFQEQQHPQVKKRKRNRSQNHGYER